MLILKHKVGVCTLSSRIRPGEFCLDAAGASASFKDTGNVSTEKEAGAAEEQARVTSIQGQPGWQCHLEVPKNSRRGKANPRSLDLFWMCF